MNEFRSEETPERIQAFEDLVRDLKAMDEEYKKDVRQVYLRKLKELSTKKKKSTEVVNDERND
jgi:hypothetical protein